MISVIENPLSFVVPIADEQPLPNDLCRIVADYTMDFSDMHKPITLVFCKNIPVFLQQLELSQLEKIAQKERNSANPTLIHGEIIRRMQTYASDACIKICAYWSAKFQIPRPAIEYHYALNEEHMLGLVSGGHLKQLRKPLSSWLKQLRSARKKTDAYTAQTIGETFFNRLFNAAARSGNIETFNFLYDQVSQEIAPFIFDRIWCDALKIAAKNGHFAMIEYMMKKRPLTNKEDIFPIARAAISRGHFAMFLKILHLIPAPETPKDTGLYRSLLFNALEGGVLDAIKHIIRNEQIDESNKIQDLRNIDTFLNDHNSLKIQFPPLAGNNIMALIEYVQKEGFQEIHKWLVDFGKKHVARN